MLTPTQILPFLYSGHRTFSQTLTLRKIQQLEPPYEKQQRDDAEVAAVRNIALGVPGVITTGNKVALSSDLEASQMALDTVAPTTSSAGVTS
jgi:hypothetical protein